jgi:hypothetical protein
MVSKRLHVAVPALRISACLVAVLASQIREHRRGSIGHSEPLRDRFQEVYTKLIEPTTEDWCVLTLTPTGLLPDLLVMASHRLIGRVSVH